MSQVGRYTVLGERAHLAMADTLERVYNTANRVGLRKNIEDCSHSSQTLNFILKSCFAKKAK